MGVFLFRCGIVGVYPFIRQPVRIEFFDTEVDSIRDFDVESQRSEGNIEHVDITTASDYIITEDVLRHTKHKLKQAYEDTRPKIEIYV